MRTVTPDDLAKDWPALANEAERTPIRVHRDGGPDVVLVSEAEYQRFRRYAGEQLIEVMDRMGAEAKRRGLTEEELEKLLADES